ncbi:hypothetical protein DFH09DRAFT_1084546 [Mycena vulgaris]|nr:hypothetical protein DFH09DRAFT_1084546 [Mycena vulgaris]
MHMFSLPDGFDQTRLFHTMLSSPMHGWRIALQSYWDPQVLFGEVESDKTYGPLNLPAEGLVSTLLFGSFNLMLMLRPPQKRVDPIWENASNGVHFLSDARQSLPTDEYSGDDFYTSSSWVLLHSSSHDDGPGIAAAIIFPLTTMSELTDSSVSSSIPLGNLATSAKAFKDDTGHRPASRPVPNPTRSFWIDTPHANPLAAEGSEGPFTDDADICIIGPGITGVSAAYHLFIAVERGEIRSAADEPLLVKILEARDFCSGATGSLLAILFVIY